MIARLRSLVHAGRWTPTQAATFGEAIGSVGYVAVGPFCLVVSLPTSWRLADPVISIFDLNAHLREVARAAREMAED